MILYEPSMRQILWGRQVIFIKKALKNPVFAEKGRKRKDKKKWRNIDQKVENFLKKPENRSDEFKFSNILLKNVFSGFHEEERLELTQIVKDDETAEETSQRNSRKYPGTANEGLKDVPGIRSSGHNYS